MKLRTQLGLPVVLALGLLLAACDNNTPTAPAANTSAPAADAAADAEKAAAEAKAAEEAAAAEKAAADAKAAEEAKAAEAAAAAAKAEEEKKAAEAAAAAKAEEEAKAAEAAAAASSDAAAKGAADAKAAIEAAATAEPAADADAAAKGAADAAAAIEAAPAIEAPAMEAAAPGVLPATGLKPDTLIAAKADTSSIAYLGVWAPDAAACATIDQAGAAGYVVITAISVRQGSDLTVVDAAPLADGKATLTAGDKTIELSMPAADQLQVGSGTPLVRCAAN